MRKTFCPISRESNSLLVALLITFGSFNHEVQADKLTEPPSALAILREPNLSSPREVFEVFWNSMNQRRELVKRGEPGTGPLAIAVSCLDTSLLPAIARSEEAQQAAIRLKEVIDRVAVPDFKKMPDEEASSELSRWSWLGTRIIITKQNTEDGKQSFLFSAETVRDAFLMYNQVKHLPYVKGGGMGAGLGAEFKIQWAWANQIYLGLALWQWLGLFFLILLGLTIRLIVALTLRFICMTMKNSRPDWNHECLKSMEWPVSLLIASSFWYFSVKALEITGLPLSITLTIVKLTFYISIVWAGVTFTGTLGRIATERARNKGNIDHHLVKLLSQSARIFVLILGTLFAAQGLGFNVVSLVAGLGIGGLAVAMAAKDTLANFFGSIAIMLDHPFRVGHWVKVGDSEGIVEEIGFRSTRIRTFYDSLISVPNSEIVTGQVDNLGMRNYRRVRTTIGITYDTSAEKIEAFIEGIKNIIIANPTTRKETFQVTLNDFGASSLNILLNFFVTVPTWAEELVERQRIFLEIIRLARTLGVEFAFPTQTVHIETTPEHPTPRRGGPTSPEEMRQLAKEFSQGGSLSRPRGLGLFKPAYEERRI